MKITFSLDGKKKTLEVNSGTTLRDCLKAEGVNEETGLIKLNNEICHPLQKLSDGDTLEFVNIIYGG